MLRNIILIGVAVTSTLLLGACAQAPAPVEKVEPAAVVVTLPDPIFIVSSMYNIAPEGTGCYSIVAESSENEGVVYDGTITVNVLYNKVPVDSQVFSFADSKVTAEYCWPATGTPNDFDIEVLSTPNKLFNDLKLEIDVHN